MCKPNTRQSLGSSQRCVMLKSYSDTHTLQDHTDHGVLKAEEIWLQSLIYEIVFFCSQKKKWKQTLSSLKDENDDKSERGRLMWQLKLGNFLRAKRDLLSQLICATSNHRSHFFLCSALDLIGAKFEIKINYKRPWLMNEEIECETLLMLNWELNVISMWSSSDVLTGARAVIQIFSARWSTSAPTRHVYETCFTLNNM